MVETKSLKIAVECEQSCIDDMAVFGWELKSSQEINVKESHLERGGDTLYSVTTSEHYVKLVFTRNNAMENYARIAQLEQEYTTLLQSRPAGPEPINVLLAIIGLVIYVVPGVLYIVLKSRKNKKLKAELNEWTERFNVRQREIFGEVRSLVK